MQIKHADKEIHIYLSEPERYREKSLKARGARKVARKGPLVLKLPLLAYHLDYLKRWYGPEKGIIWDESLLNLTTLPFCFSFVDQRQDNHLMWDRLFDFQKETVDFLTSTPRSGALMALSPRLGKTVVSLISLDILNLKDVLIITTPTLLDTWGREIEEWIQRPYQSCWGKDLEEGGPFLVLTTYETLFKTIEIKPGKRKRVILRESLRKHWDLIIFDESIILKTQDAYRTDASLMLRGYAEKVWLLSGSPTSRYADDLYSQFRIIYPTAFTSYWRFAGMYCDIQETVWAKTVVGDRVDTDIQKDMRDLMFVRSLHDVMDIPLVHQDVISVQMALEQETAYEEMLHDYVTVIEGKKIKAGSSLPQRIRLQQIVSSVGSSSAKVNSALDLVMTGQAASPVVIWNHWIGTGDLLEQQFRSVYGDLVGRISGGDPNRDQTIRAFQTGDIKILICSLGTGKFGLNLSSANSVIYVDKSERADDFIQSFFRVIHLNSDHVVKMFHLVTPKTTDELIQNNLAGKSESISKITDIQLSMLLKGLRG